MNMDQASMRQSATQQAHERAERECVECYVYAIGRTWYVRTEAEGQPEGSTLVYKTGEQP
jgi:hypothetical protein